MTATHFLPRQHLQTLLDQLDALGYRCIGPQVRDGTIVFDRLSDATALPVGIGAHQTPGRYRLEHQDHPRCFAWANGPQALKPLLFAPQERLWRTERDDAGRLSFTSEPQPMQRQAIIGVRACDLAALALQDAHFAGPRADPGYSRRRRDLLLVGVECGQPADTCFCASTGDGPAISTGADLALTELDTGFLVRASSEVGSALCDALPLRAPSDEERAQGAAEIDQARLSQRRSLPGRNLRESLFANLDHPRWDEVATRCLACGNCVAVCPTCFCSTEREQPSIDGSSSTHLRFWDSCFSAEHSYVHGRLLRPDTRTRYRQWLTHKLGSWHDQYGRSGCVGCGRCIAWCPVGIDLTAETNAICADASESAQEAP
ncbi:MAG: 4Fe-4S dicluster domain-containing protein [Chromatiaceae bacterium]|nr:4Fe-4S dicluster domain-containing protein [Chromatiaceae bacterium]MCF7995517.1 4Fe-4S dicluster domain-containing protein [Chromatiaceae bacterium]MCF8016475.1 4Fe-4S dicluster domain-containing protein [Chromatiaceae bacterium]